MNKNHHHIVSRPILFGIMTALSATAGANDFEAIVGSIVDASPAVATVEANGLAEVEALKRENTLEGPELEFERLYAPHRDGHRWSAGVSQSLPVPGQFSRLGKTTQTLRQRNNAASEAARLEIDQATRQMLIQYIAANTDYNLAHRIAQTSGQLLIHYQKAYEMGEATIIDLNKIKIESARAQAAESRAAAILDGYRAEIRSISPDDETTRLALALTDYPPVENLPDLNRLIANYEQSPTARLALSEAEYATATASYASSSLWPRLAVGYAHAFEEQTHFNGFTLSLQLPAWGAAKSQKAESAQRELATRFAANDTRNKTVAMISAKYAEAKALRQQLNDFAPAVAVADNFALLRKALDGGELTLLEYLQEQQYFVEAQREYIGIARDHALAVTALLPYM